MALTHGGAVLWLTGLSGSGKTTLANTVADRLRRAGVDVAIIDGDALRRGGSSDLGYRLADRSENARRASELAIQLVDSARLVVVALISPLRADRAASADRIRSRGVAFAEVFVNAPLSECERRDPKKLYQLARAGRLALFTGIDSPYEAPLAPDLEIRTDRETEAVSAEKLIAFALLFVERRQ